MPKRTSTAARAMTLADSLNHAVEEVAELIAGAGGNSVETLYRLAATAFDYALSIAKSARFAGGLTPAALACMYPCLMMTVYRLRHATRVDWPLSPGIVFGAYTGDSALALASRFARAVSNETGFMLGYGASNKAAPPGFDPAFPPQVAGWIVEEKRLAKPILAWHKRTLEAIGTRILPPAEQWPGWQMLRDAERLFSLLSEERKRARANGNGAAGDPAATGGESHTAELRGGVVYLDRQPCAMGGAQGEVFEKLVKSKPNIVAEYRRDVIHEIRKTLRKRGFAWAADAIRNRRDHGYFLALDWADPPAND